MQAPRGEIVDRRGRVLVENRPVIRLELRPGDLPSSRPERRRELAALARLADLSPAQLRRKIRETPRFGGYSVVAPAGARPPDALLPARAPAPLPRRQRRAHLRPQLQEGSLAAHVLGLVGQVEPCAAEGPRVRRARARRHRSARRGSSTPTTTYLRGTRARKGSRWTPSAGRRAILGQRGGPRRGQPAPHPRLGPAGDRRGGAPVHGAAGRLRGDERPHGGRARDGLLPRLRPGLLHEAAHPGAVPLARESGRRPADQSRRPGWLSDRVRLQADNGDRGARGGADRRPTRSSTTRVPSTSAG